MCEVGAWSTVPKAAANGHVCPATKVSTAAVSSKKIPSREAHKAIGGSVD